ncbi:MAG TPA: CsbD family protein [Acidobacteriaceae bacterium]|nr:CsbD family protein [Acidobacteriaceae bacterium]
MHKILIVDDKEHVKGAADNVKGKAKEVAIQVGGNKTLEQGKADQVKGAIHNAVGDVKDAGKDAIDSVKNAPRFSISRYRSKALFDQARR